jgi:cell shape-determining protein MreC
MTGTKINLLLLPLLFAVLLSIASNLKVGVKIDALVFTIVSPISAPVSKLRLFTEKKYLSLKNLSVLEKQNREQKNQIAGLVSENEYLKQSITDKQVIDNFKNTFKEIIPVRLTGSSGIFIVTSSLPLDNVRPGQPLISGSVLMGTVKEVKNNTITITPLDSEKSPVFPARTASGQKGLYKYVGNTSQIVDVPSQSPVILGDMVLTEPGDLFPGNLIIGKTIRLLTVSQEPLQKAEISLYDTLDNSPDNLAIITKP